MPSQRLQVGLLYPKSPRRKARFPFRVRALLVLAGLVLFFIIPGPPRSQAAPAGQVDFYIVQPGDAWGSLAARFGIPLDLLWRANGVVNPTLLKEGQRLFIPASASQEDNEVLAFDIGPEVSLWEAALRSGNAPTVLLQLNDLDSPAEAWGQRLYAPNRQALVAAGQGPSTPTQANPAPAPQPESPTPAPVPQGALVRSRLGIQGHFSVPDDQRDMLLDMIAYDLNFGWVKYQVDWSSIEYIPGHYSIELEKLDGLVEGAFDRNLQVLLSVVKAPDWARTTTEGNGPPADYNDYYNFLRFLVQRYRGKVAAIEVWNEPNLHIEWNGGTLSGAEYVGLLAGAYETIKGEDASITVVSAGLAPTGVNDGISSVDDRLYLRQMYEAGLANYADAVGVHPYGWANPPWIRCCRDPNGPPTHNDHPSFFFLNTIEDYRSIQAEFGDSERPLWATEFGWGTMERLDLPIPEEQPFLVYMNEERQAEYIRDAFLMAQEWDFMGPMFLWNLNVATLEGFDANQAAYSILIELDRPRVAYQVLRDIPKIDQ